MCRGAKNNEMRLERCSRTNDVIEPMIKPQWYINCHEMGKNALDVAINDENRKLEFIQRQYTAEWRRFSLIMKFYYKTIIDSSVNIYTGSLLQMAREHT